MSAKWQTIINKSVHIEHLLYHHEIVKTY